MKDILAVAGAILFMLPVFAFAAWVDAPSGPPNYTADGTPCPDVNPADGTPDPCHQADFQPMNLGATPQAKNGMIGATAFFDAAEGAGSPTHVIDLNAVPGTNSGSFGGDVTVDGALCLGGVCSSSWTDGGVGINYWDQVSGTLTPKNSTWRVGVGVTPGAMFAVNNPDTANKQGSAGDAIYAYANSANAAVSAEQAGSGYGIYSSAPQNYFSGNIGIGTASPPIAKLDVAGNIRLSDGENIRLDRVGNDYSWAIWNDANNTFRLGNYINTGSWYNINAFAVKDTGDVGIGITNPGYKLDVQGGQVNASGGLCMAGDCKASWSAVTGGAIGGSGTLNTIPLWTPNSTTLGNSIITQSGSTITVSGIVYADALYDGGTYLVDPASGATAGNFNGTVYASNFVAGGSNVCRADGTNCPGAASETDPEVGIISTNYVPRWNGLALVTGQIYDSGGNNGVGIGTNNTGGSLLSVGGVGSSLASIYGYRSSGEGIRGQSTSGIGVKGESQSSWAVYGESQSSIGVYGQSASDTGVRGRSLATSVGTGVSGEATSDSDGTGIGVYGVGNGYGVLGVGNTANSTGVRGTGFYGVYGYGTGANPSAGVYGTNIGSGYAGYFRGGVYDNTVVLYAATNSNYSTAIKAETLPGSGGIAGDFIGNTFTSGLAPSGAGIIGDGLVFCASGITHGTSAFTCSEPYVRIIGAATTTYFRGMHYLGLAVRDQEAACMALGGVLVGSYQTVDVGSNITIASWNVTNGSWNTNSSVGGFVTQNLVCTL